MSLFSAARQGLARWGGPLRFATKHIISAAVPGGSVVAELVDAVLDCAQQTARDQQEFDSRADQLGSPEELKHVAAVLAAVNGPLADLIDRVAHLEGMPEAAERIIRIALATEEKVTAGFAHLAVICGRLDRLEALQRQALEKLGYGQDQLHAYQELVQRQLGIVVAFVEELRTAGLQPRELAAKLASMQMSLAGLQAGRAPDVAAVLQTLEDEQPSSAAVQEARAIEAVYRSEPRLAERRLRRAVMLRPDDTALSAISRRLTQTVGGSDTPPGAGGQMLGLRAGDVVDGWTLTHLLGQGGWGQVFRAQRDQRVRALKMLHPELGSDLAFEESFKREVQTLAGLGRQPHLVSLDLFGYDRQRGCWYFLMELIEGESLQTRLERQGKLALTEAVALLRRVAGEGGLAEAHRRGIVHRDVKPANILLRPDGSPVLVDFGLALSGSRSLTSVTRLTGYTAMFASPEQLRGRPLDARSDVYSLAATLWYALTCSEPEDFDPLTLPAELEPVREVLTQALDRRPTSRPAHAAALAEMLDRREANTAAPRPFAPFAPFAPFGAQPQRARRSNVVMPALVPGLNRPVAASEIACLRGHGAAVSAVTFSPDGQVLATGNYDGIARLWSMPDGKPLLTLQGPGSAIYSVAFSPDGKLLATGSADNMARLWNVADGKHLFTLSGHGNYLWCVTFSPDGKLLATGSADTSARLWSVADGKHLFTFQGHSGGVLPVSFSPDGKLLATGSKDRTARLWNVADGRLVFTLHGHEGDVNSTAFSPNGRLLATSGDDSVTRLWSVADGKLLLTLPGHTAYVCSVAFSPDGRLLATGSHDKTARLWNVADGKLLCTLTGHGNYLWSVAFSPDGRLLATGSQDNTARLWLLHVEGESCDWSLSPTSHNPRASGTLIRGGDGLVYAGDYLWLQLGVENTGKGDLQRTWARIESDHPSLNGLDTVIGRVKPGEKVERCLAVLLPADTPPGEIRGEVVFHDGLGFAPPLRPFVYQVANFPRSDLPLRWRLVNDTSGHASGSGDGKPRRGESVDVAVTLENHSGEALESLYLTLHAIDVPSGTAVTRARYDLDPLPDGGGEEGRLTFYVKPTGRMGRARFELRVESDDGRTFAIVPVETTIW